jgi:hypothetical protein
MQSKRTLEDVRAAIAETTAAQRQLHAMISRTMRIIKAARFQPKDSDTGKRNPVLKDLREYESSLRSADRHMARLVAEENSLLRTVADSITDQWSEFAPKKEQKTA